MVREAFDLQIKGEATKIGPIFDAASPAYKTFIFFSVFCFCGTGLCKVGIMTIPAIYQCHSSRPNLTVAAQFIERHLNVLE